METDDQDQIRTTPLTPMGSEDSSKDTALTDSAIGGALGAGQSKPPASPGTWQPPPAEELQRDFPQYEIRGILGRGGMGAVYRGWQASLERFVAIKILPPGMDDGVSDFTERFKREARAMAHLNHPGIVGVYDAGTTRSGLLYFVMECIEGTDVHKLLNEHKTIEPGEALRITEHVCNALGYAHAHNVIHRDIKPSNIMIEADGDVKVADFGLAKSTDPGMTVLTVSNVTMGTVDFMAPEGLAGVANVDHRADIYAVGVMLYQMLTGKLPRGKYDPPSRMVPGLDRRLDRVVDRALQPKPELRYQNAREMSAALAPIAQSIAKRTPAPGETPASRKAPLLIALALIAAIVAALVHFFPREKTAPAEPPSPAPRPPSIATKDAPFVNTLGQEFVPVPGSAALFCRWETRVRDYAVFAEATNANDAWQRMERDDVPVGREPDHPVAGVNWADAREFCEWLTAKERREGKLPKGMEYRLPTDEEWSLAVGLAKEYGTTPKDKSGRNTVAFPWGGDFPPPSGKAGNYADSAFHGKFPESPWLAGYTDGFATTSPAGTFAPNPFGIYDLGGNVWEWCEDLYDAKGPQRVARGGSWGHFDRDSMLSSYRRSLEPDSRLPNYGFRCVLAPVSARPGASLAPAQAKNIAAAANDAPFVNTLGQEFVPVPGTHVLFCRWDTRVRDFAEYARVNTVDGAWIRQEKDGVPVSRELEYPVVGVNWNDATAFCAWLTDKETTEGKLPHGMRYRLPADEEWSLASGLAKESGATPRDKSEAASGAYPWGTGFPPPKGRAGNYADAAWHAKFPNEKNWIEGYSDDYATTSPVGSFEPNPLGLYDMGGNAWQWCEDAWDPAGAERVLRGASWNSHEQAELRLSARRHAARSDRDIGSGFRCVLDVSAK